MYYTIINDNILRANNKEALTKYYSNVYELPNDYKENKYIVQNGELVLNPDYEAQKAQDYKNQKIEELKLKLEELDKQRIRALCEPSNRTENQTWLEYYNEQIINIRKELQSLQN